MALTSKKHESFYVTTGSGSDKVDSTKLTTNVTGTTNHAISFGALTTTLVKGKAVYSVVMTVTDSSGAKTVAKAITLTLA